VAFAIFIAFGHFRAFDPFVFRRAKPDFLYARLVFPVQQMEAYGFGPGGYIEPDGKGDEPERDVSLPNGGWHALLFATAMPLMPRGRDASDPKAAFWPFPTRAGGWLKGPSRRD
jgi:hypothetical protein